MWFTCSVAHHSKVGCERGGRRQGVATLVEAVSVRHVCCSASPPRLQAALAYCTPSALHDALAFSGWNWVV